MKARLIGPLLMVALGATLLVGFGGGSTVDAGTTSPCTTLVNPVGGGVDPCTTTTTDPCAPQVAIADPCTTTTIDPCSVGAAAGFVNPCVTTTTVEEVTTTAVATTDPPAVDGTTTEPPAALPDDLTSTPPAAAAPSAAPTELVRTGSDNGPLTAAGIALVVLGAGLALYERRNALRDRA